MTRPKRILIVDDEPQIHRFLHPSLVVSGYEVLMALTGQHALRALTTNRPDAVLLDLGLPDMDGKAVIEQIRKRSDVPIIVLSARDREAEKIAALDLGADDYLNKPFGIGELLARLRSLLRRRPATAFEAGGAFKRRPGRDRYGEPSCQVRGRRGAPHAEGVRPLCLAREARRPCPHSSLFAD
jgi:DNA-binding response OmpR family regulator